MTVTGAPQAAAGREKRNRLEEIGLARAVGAHESDEVAGSRQARRAIAAEIREHEAADAGGGHEAPMSSPLRRPIKRRRTALAATIRTVPQIGLDLDRTSLFQNDKALISLSFVESEGSLTGYDPG